MRLTAEIVRNAPCYYNALRERELSLRAYKIPAIENLGVTQDTFDVIDLSNNHIIKLDNLPLLAKLHTLLLSNNQIRVIDSGLGSALPALTTIILTNNKLTELSDLDPLFDIPTLTHVSIVANPVTSVPDYRAYLIARLPKLKVLDFNKVRPAEREAAPAIYKSIVSKKRTQQLKEQQQDDDDDADNDGSERQRAQYAKKQKLEVKITAQQKLELIARIQKAQTLEEINRLELMLSGHTPIEL